MAAKSTNKGKKGERELLNLLGAELGQRFARNLQQSDRGGCDCLELVGVALECKRHAKPAINAWWTQALGQAAELQRMPVLAYRIDNQKWRFVLPARAFIEGMPRDDQRVEVDLLTFCDWYRLTHPAPTMTEVEALAALTC